MRTEKEILIDNNCAKISKIENIIRQKIKSYTEYGKVSILQMINFDEDMKYLNNRINELKQDNYDIDNYDN